MTNFVTNYFYDLPEDLQQMIYEKEHRMKLDEVFEEIKVDWAQLPVYHFECDECGDEKGIAHEDYSLHYCLGNWYCFRCLKLAIKTTVIDASSDEEDDEPIIDEE